MKADWHVNSIATSACPTHLDMVSNLPSVDRFSPFEELNLVSCGMENIRFWRVKERWVTVYKVELGWWMRAK